MGLGQTVQRCSMDLLNAKKSQSITFEFWKKHVFNCAHCAIFKIFIFGWQSFSAPDLVQVDDLNERRFLEVFDMRVRQAAIRGWIYRLVKGNIWTGNHGSPHQIEWRFVWKTSLKPIQCIFWGMTFISTSYFRVNRNVSRLLPTASFSWMQLFVYLEDWPSKTIWYVCAEEYTINIHQYH